MKTGLSAKTNLTLSLALCLCIPSFGMAQVPQEQHSKLAQIKGALGELKEYVREHATAVGTGVAAIGALSLAFLYKNSLLRASVRFNSPTMAKAFIACGADDNPLHWAQKGDARTALYFSKNILDNSLGTRIASEWNGGERKSQISGNMARIYESIAKDDVDFVKLLHTLNVDLKFDLTPERGARPGTGISSGYSEGHYPDQYPINTFTALNCAAYCGAYNTAQVLVENCGQGVNDLNYYDYKGKSFEYGFSKMFVPDKKRTPLYWAQLGKQVKKGTAEPIYIRFGGSEDLFKKRPIENWDTIIAFLQSKGAQ